jgi:hypothetical protein
LKRLSFRPIRHFKHWVHHFHFTRALQTEIHHSIFFFIDLMRADHTFIVHDFELVFLYNNCQFVLGLERRYVIELLQLAGSSAVKIKYVGLAFELFYCFGGSYLC